MMNNLNYKVGLYCRLSLDDGSSNESGSITTQKMILEKYCRDNETSLFCLSSRYYSPELCRFISPDDVEYLDPESVNGLNLYYYCLNNPINNVDYNGRWTFSFNLNLNLNIFIGASISIGFAFDSNGESAIQWSYSHPFDSETPNIGILDAGNSVTGQYTNLDSVDDLDGIFSYVGGSVGSGLYVDSLS